MDNPNHTWRIKLVSLLYINVGVYHNNVPVEITLIPLGMQRREKAAPVVRAPIRYAPHSQQIAFT